MVIYTLPPARVSAAKVNEALTSLGLTALPSQSQATLTGRAAGAGTGAPGELSVTQAQTILRDGWAYVAFSGTVPASGLLRAPHNSVIIKVKDSGGTDRDFLVFGDSTDEISFGLRNVANRYWISVQTGGFAFFFNSSNFFSVDNSRVSLKRDEVRFQNDLTAPRIYAQDTSSGTGLTVMYDGGGAAAASATGGGVKVRTGAPGSGGASGLGQLIARRNGGTEDTAVSWDTSGSAPRLAFYGGTPSAKLAVTGSRGGNAALASLLTQLAALGLITDSTSA